MSLTNSVLSFSHLSYQVGVKGGARKTLLDDVSVEIKAGELLAIMGPSGAGELTIHTLIIMRWTLGKSTLLDVMAFRKHAAGDSFVRLNNRLIGAHTMHRISTFVEQEDALLGVLTVRESITYALRLHLPLLPRKEVAERVNRVIATLGLQSCAEQKIGTPISRGISGGQKRRVTAACAMVTYPRILFLDEVTSGLDSTSAREVMSAIRTLAIAEGIIVIATIHQPSLETLAQFTNLLLLAEGKTCYSGAVEDLEGFFERWGRPVGRFHAPAEHAMNFLNNDFATDESKVATADDLRDYYISTIKVSTLSISTDEEHGSQSPDDDAADELGKAGILGTLFWNSAVLSERSFKNYSRNLLAYGVRAGMYGGMGFMIATIWIRLGHQDSTINDRLSVHFYSVAFLAFMSVAGIPSFLEERSVYYRETKNGLYSTLPFVISNTLVNIPFLFGCTLLFTLICYWAIGLHTGGLAFFRFLAFLFLAILVGESQVLVVASILPVFVAALAISAFINGFWMSVGGYFIKARSLPRFWYYSFHFMDYQKYAFELITNSDFRGLAFQCQALPNGSCVCAYPSSTPTSCTVSGEDVLSYLEIGSVSYGKWAAILVSIFLIFRISIFDA
ncbi:hypothetical protein DXG01_014620 [Tephrocybe rancida]|nr:hypothetical protein DXG01_014620 [Tephrocybe rancida]